jgi:hypothetical protein
MRSKNLKRVFARSRPHIQKLNLLDEIAPFKFYVKAPGYRLPGAFLNSGALFCLVSI